MATTTQLQKIAELVDQLAPVGNKQRGMPIEADEWNTIVKVLSGILEVSRAQEEDLQGSLDRRFAPLVHDHLGQVTLAWLDADLQKRISDAGAGVPTRLLVADMDQKISNLSAQVAQFTVLLQAMRRQMDGFTVNDADREKALRGVDTRFAGLENLRTSVTGLAAQFDGLKSSVNTVIDLRKSLSDANGKAIDVNKLQQDVTSLQGLSDNLKGIDGNLVRLRDIQLKLNEVSDAAGVGGPGGLQSRLDKLSSDMETRVNGRLDTKVQALHDQIQTENTNAITQVRNDFTTAIGKATTSLDQSSTEKVKAAEERLNAATGDRITTAMQSLRSETAASITAQFDQRLAGLPAQISSTATKAANDAVNGLSATLTTTLTNQMQAQAAAANTKLDNRLAGFQQTMDAFRVETQKLVKSSVASASDTLTGTLTSHVDTQVSQARQAIEGELDGRVKSAVDAADATLDTRVGAVVDQRLSTLDSRIGQSVTQATRNLPGEITTEVKSQITTLNLSSQIQDASTKTTQQLRSEMAQAIADQQAKTATSINNAVTLLRGEIHVAAKNATDSAIASSSANISSLRTDFNNTLNDRLKNVVFRSLTPAGGLR